MGCGCNQNRLPKAPRVATTAASAPVPQLSELDMAIKQMQAKGIGLTRDDRAEIARTRLALVADGMPVGEAHAEARLRIVRSLTETG